jgi:hypothetical protein
MGRRHRALLALASLVVACRGQDDQETRPLPAPEPSANTQPLPLEPASAPAERPRERAKPSKPEEPRDDPAVTPPSEAAQAPPSTPSPPPSAAPVPPAVALPTVDAGCQQACQVGLQTCLAQVPADPDGGTNLDGLAACKRSLDDCKTKCVP